MRIRNLLSRLHLGEALLRIITVASYILQVAVKLWSPFAAADTAPQHILAQLSFDLVVCDQTFLLVLDVLLCFPPHEPVAAAQHLGIFLVDEI